MPGAPDGRRARGGGRLEGRIEAAPWLLGSEPEEAVPPDELFERLQPFKESVADEIRAADEREP